mmetsp:Transcript_8645/g.26263  ORF Transcript_8645/g.26263 Transcript_8645/m.26263 type:complete len:362 (+) Transcript_8645:685-1770(+)
MLLKEVLHLLIHHEEDGAARNRHDQHRTEAAPEPARAAGRSKALASLQPRLQRVHGVQGHVHCNARHEARHEGHRGRGLQGLRLREHPRPLCRSTLVSQPPCLGRLTEAVFGELKGPEEDKSAETHPERADAGAGEEARDALRGVDLPDLLAQESRRRGQLACPPAAVFGRWWRPEVQPRLHEVEGRGERRGDHASDTAAHRGQPGRQEAATLAGSKLLERLVQGVLQAAVGDVAHGCGLERCQEDGAVHRKGETALVTRLQPLLHQVHRHTDTSGRQLPDDRGKHDATGEDDVAMRCLIGFQRVLGALVRGEEDGGRRCCTRDGGSAAPVDAPEAPGFLEAEPALHTRLEAIQREEDKFG